MECSRYLRNVQDLLADWKTPYERRFGESFKGPIIPFGALVEYLPNSERDKAIIHQFGQKVLTGIFLGYALKGDILKADIEELEKLDASEIYPRRLNAKEVLITHKHGEFVFLVTDGSATLSGRDYEFQESTLRRESTVRRENLKAIGKSFNLKKQKMTKKYMRIFGLFKETSFIVIILYREFNCTCQGKNHSLFH